MVLFLFFINLMFGISNIGFSVTNPDIVGLTVGGVGIFVAGMCFNDVIDKL